MTVFWVDGRDDGAFDLNDRALHYGDGVFETIAVRAGRAEFLDRHLQRLLAGCERLGLDRPDAAALRGEIEARAAQAGPEPAVVKLIVGRRAAGRGYRSRSGQGTTRLSALYPGVQWPQRHRDDGVRVRVCDLRLAGQPRLAGIKHLNRLEQVLARAEWDDGYEEGLMLDYNGRLIEGTMSNLFVIRDGVLLSPSLAACGVAGIMRSVVLDTARALGMQTAVTDIDGGSLSGAQSVFLCNSLIDIWPVASIEGLGRLRIDDRVRQLQQALATLDRLQQGNWYAV